LPTLAELPDRDVTRRAEPAGAGASSALTTPTSVAVVASEPGTNARIAEIERAARAYESAMAALVAEAEASLPGAEEEPAIADAPVVETQAPEPVTLPEGVVTPAQPVPALPPKRPHSVAVIVARGADF
jgi:hypothetical protein